LLQQFYHEGKLIPKHQHAFRPLVRGNLFLIDGLDRVRHRNMRVAQYSGTCQCRL
jgi:hypothetical protein